LSGPDLQPLISAIAWLCHLSVNLSERVRWPCRPSGETEARQECLSLQRQWQPALDLRSGKVWRSAAIRWSQIWGNCSARSAHGAAVFIMHQEAVRIGAELSISPRWRRQFPPARSRPVRSNAASTIFLAVRQTLVISPLSAAGSSPFRGGRLRHRMQQSRANCSPPSGTGRVRPVVSSPLVVGRPRLPKLALAFHRLPLSRLARGDDAWTWTRWTSRSSDNSRPAVHFLTARAG